MTGLLLDIAYVGATVIVSYIGGEALINNGLATALVGGGVALCLGILRTFITLRRLRLTEFEALQLRENNLHNQEKDFLQNQIAYLEQLESTNRNRLHAVNGENQRSILHIRVCEDLARDGKFQLPEYRPRLYDDIVKEFPLPEPPTTLRKG